jgi:hypothetical protein
MHKNTPIISDEDTEALFLVESPFALVNGKEIIVNNYLISDGSKSKTQWIIKIAYTVLM